MQYGLKYILQCILHTCSHYIFSVDSCQFRTNENRLKNKHRTNRYLSDAFSFYSVSVRQHHRLYFLGQLVEEGVFAVVSWGGVLFFLLRLPLFDEDMRFAGAVVFAEVLRANAHFAEAVVVDREPAGAVVGVMVVVAADQDADPDEMGDGPLDGGRRQVQLSCPAAGAVVYPVAAFADIAGAVEQPIELADEPFLRVGEVFEQVEVVDAHEFRISFYHDVRLLCPCILHYFSAVTAFPYAGCCACGSGARWRGKASPRDAGWCASASRTRAA